MSNKILDDFCDLQRRHKKLTMSNPSGALKEAPAPAPAPAASANAPAMGDDVIINVQGSNELLLYDVAAMAAEGTPQFRMLCADGGLTRLTGL
jgi:hypothetical protein